MNEIWKDIKGYEGLYQVSNAGRVKSLARKVNCQGGQRTCREKILKPSYNNEGYLFLDLSENGMPKAHRVNRLVAEAFIPNPENFDVVNHKDRDRANNKVDNLEWCTVEYNNRYSSAKSICQYALNGELVTEWEAISDASRELGINVSNIAQCCKGNRKTAGGYIWRYKEAV